MRDLEINVHSKNLHIEKSSTTKQALDDSYSP